MEHYIKKGWQLNPNTKIVEAITKRIAKNNGQCPCNNPYSGTPDAICPCKAYREEDHCHCQLYVKINEE